MLKGKTIHSGYGGKIWDNWTFQWTTMFGMFGFIFGTAQIAHASKRLGWQCVKVVRLQSFQLEGTEKDWKNEKLRIIALFVHDLIGCRPASRAWKKSCFLYSAQFPCFSLQCTSKASKPANPQWHSWHTTGAEANGKSSSAGPTCPGTVCMANGATICDWTGI